MSVIIELLFDETSIEITGVTDAGPPGPPGAEGPPGPQGDPGPPGTGGGAVDSVNTLTGNVILGPTEVGAQPASSILADIAAAAVQPFGISLLEKATAAAARQAIGVLNRGNTIDVSDFATVEDSLAELLSNPGYTWFAPPGHYDVEDEIFVPAGSNVYMPDAVFHLRDVAAGLRFDESSEMQHLMLPKVDAELTAPDPVRFGTGQGGAGSKLTVYSTLIENVPAGGAPIALLNLQNSIFYYLRVGASDAATVGVLVDEGSKNTTIVGLYGSRLDGPMLLATTTDATLAADPQRTSKLRIIGGLIERSGGTGGGAGAIRLEDVEEPTIEGLAINANLATPGNHDAAIVLVAGGNRGGTAHGPTGTFVQDCQIKSWDKAIQIDGPYGVRTALNSQGTCGVGYQINHAGGWVEEDSRMQSEPATRFATTGAATEDQVTYSPHERIDDMGAVGPMTYTLHAAAGASEQLAFSSGFHVAHRVELNNGNCTLAFSGAVAGVPAHMTVEFVQDATGSRGLTFPAEVRFPNGLTPGVDRTALSTEVFEFWTIDGGTTIYGRKVAAAEQVRYTDHGNTGSAEPITFDPLGDVTHRLVLNAANVTITFNSATAGVPSRARLLLTQDAVGGRLVTWPTVTWLSGSAPVLASAANAVTIVDLFTVDGGTTYYGRHDTGYQALDADLTALAAAGNSAVLAATTASFTTADETKLDFIGVTQPVDLDAIETRVNSLDAAVVLRGSWDASAGTFPGAGAAQSGDSYIVSVGGTVDGIVFTANDRVVAIVDNASTTVYVSNWLKLDYTDQVLSVDGQTGAVNLTAVYQPLNAANLSAIAALTTTAFGRSLLEAANAAALRTLAALGSAAVATLIDDDTFATATSANIPSAESTKAYVDAIPEGTSGDGILVGPPVGSTVPIAVDSTVARLTALQTLTNKTLTSPVLGGTVAMAPGTGNTFGIGGANDASRNNVFEIFGGQGVAFNYYSPAVAFMHSAGTYGAPTQTPSGSTLATISVRGYTDAAAYTAAAARLRMLSADAFTASARGATMHLDVTPIGTTTVTEALRLTADAVPAIQGLAGAVGVPTFGFIADPNTGIYNFAADQLGISAGGVARMVLGSTSYHEFALRVGAIAAGSAAVPVSMLDVIQPTAGQLVHRLSTVQTNDDVIEDVKQGRAATTDGTITTIQSIPIPASTTVVVRSFIVARRTGGSAGTAEDGAGYVLVSTWKNVAGTATQIGATTVSATHESQAGWDAVHVGSTSNCAVRVTGATNNNITWHVTTRFYAVSS